MSFTIYLRNNKPLKFNRTLIMGILNATPDSFSDGGELASQSEIDKRIKAIINAGADILDVGGESTRPGHSKVSSSNEIKRILPVIKSIRKISKSIPISVDTQKASVAEEALKFGASFINDVSSLGDPKMADVVKSYSCSIILMRNRPIKGTLAEGCKKQFRQILDNAAGQGIEKSHILLDPGLGFGDLANNDYKTLPGSDPEANLALAIGIQEYSMNFPVVIGASRKRFIGELTGVDSAKDRLGGSLAIAMLARQAGTAIVRVHDAKETALAFNRPLV